MLMRGLLPTFAKTGFCVLLVAAAILGGLWVQGAKASTTTVTTVALGQQSPGSAPASRSVAGGAGSSQIAVKLVPGAELIADGSQPVSAGISGLASKDGRRLDLSNYRVRESRRLGQLGVDVLDVPDQASVDAVLGSLKSSKNVLWAEKVEPMYASLIPNDAYYPYQWAPAKVGLPQTWDSTTGLRWWTAGSTGTSPISADG